MSAAGSHATPRTHPDEVHVWRIQLDAPAEVLARRADLLSDDERKRHRRLRFERHRRRYAACRGAVRELLGSYLETPPAALEFAYGPHGKPRLAGPAADSGLRFNVSHSADEALVAVTVRREVGVDIERIKPAVDLEAIARRFFSTREVDHLMALPEETRTRAFFGCWTRKESYLKACGGGLQLPLDGFDVAFGPGAPAELIEVRWDAEEASRWTMADLRVPEGYRGAVTVAGQGWRLRDGDPRNLDEF